MKDEKIYCVGPFTCGQVMYEDKSFSIPDYLMELGFDVTIEPQDEHIENIENIIEHVNNLKETSTLIIDATEDCGFNVPWDIGYLHAAITKKNKNRNLILLKIGSFENTKSRWRMNHSLEDLKELFDATEITDIEQMRIVVRKLNHKTKEVSRGVLKEYLKHFDLKAHTSIDFGK